MFRLVVVTLLAAWAGAFAPSFVRHHPLTMRQVLLSDEETEAILKSGTDCMESECAVDDVASLIDDLKEQERLLSARLTKVMNLVSHLQQVNAKEQRKTDEVRAFVKDLLRVFNTDKPVFNPNSIEFTEGPFDAYDVLGAKPWKPSE